MKNLFSGIFRLAGAVLMGYAAFLMIKWYVYWLAYYFIGNIKPALIIGLLTFFLSPLAGLADLFWHSFPKHTLTMWIYFLVYFIGGRIAFLIGYRLRDKN